jgi:hypothetical protein
MLIHISFYRGPEQNQAAPTFNCMYKIPHFRNETRRCKRQGWLFGGVGTQLYALHAEVPPMVHGKRLKTQLLQVSLTPAPTRVRVIVL